MHLIKLSSNKDSFHDVHFKNGLNLIVGKKQDPDSKDIKKTYNGVGKSLLIELIHFCLGSNNKEEFSKKLSEWEFKLEFEIEGEKFETRRKCNEQDVIYLNNRKMELKPFNQFFKEKLFFLDDNFEFLSFRSLISRFIRRYKESYNSFDNILPKEKPFQVMLNNAYLLGLSYDLMMKKYKLKIELDRIIKLKNNLESDRIFKKYFIRDKNVDIEKKDLEDKIKKFNSDLNNFKVAENYYQIQQETEVLKTKLLNCKNKIIKINRELNFINKSLNINPDISDKDVISFYKEARLTFDNKIVNKLEIVSNFHKKIIEGRIKRLKKEKNELLNIFAKKEEERKDLGGELDRSIKFLGEHRALDQFTAINNKMADLKISLSKIEDYKRIIKEYKEESGKLSNKLNDENTATDKYLEENVEIINKNIDLFRSFSKEFYENKPGGIAITNNEGKNQIRFNIKVEIEDDTSDGIGEVKIFCFDLTMLLASFNHNIHFIIHDSRLFSNMDPRQRATLFRIAHEKSEELNTQYIATINDDNLSPLKEYYEENEFKNIINDNIVLELTDESENSKLLGKQIDLKY